ncbi:MAG TPA: uridine diphosphate-N-acetylglucosamine-binding protein YvcK [Acidimicrobiales bacterium]|nr:uridine diphosphate-N-acetylglucosamine-binding protein YvcK [Acidimicrobiales bacterium]
MALGGGHGLATTLRAARLYAASTTAVVSVADDGGSSGRLREIAGIPAPGDLRRCLVAMAAEGSQWAEAFEYRFPAGSGDLEGHALGNLIIAGLANVTGDFGRALDLAAQLVGSVGRVLPATSVPVVLKAEVAGREVVGQVAVSRTGGRISSVSIVPPDAAVPTAAVEAIAAADQVVLGPGSLYTSVLAVAAVPGIRRALAARRSGRVYVCNLRPQPPETEGFGEEDHLAAVLDHGVPVDVFVGSAPEGPPTVLGVPTVRAPLAREDGGGHDPRLLAAVLGGLG